MDVDGTLTDGKIYMGANGELMKAFNIKDGYGIHDILPQVGIIPVIITGRKSLIVENRCKELGIEYYYQGVVNKMETLNSFLAAQNGSLSEVAYAGDDLNDLACMQLIKSEGGIVGMPSNAAEKLKYLADFISSEKGGEGAVREFIDFIVSQSK